MDVQTIRPPSNMRVSFNDLLLRLYRGATKKNLAKLEKRILVIPSAYTFSSTLSPMRVSFVEDGKRVVLRSDKGGKCVWGIEPRNTSLPVLCVCMKPNLVEVYTGDYVPLTHHGTYPGALRE